MGMARLVVEETSAKCRRSAYVCLGPPMDIWRILEFVTCIIHTAANLQLLAILCRWTADGLIATPELALPQSLSQAQGITPKH